MSQDLEPPLEARLTGHYDLQLLMPGMQTKASSRLPKQLLPLFKHLACAIEIDQNFECVKPCEGSRPIAYTNLRTDVDSSLCMALSMALICAGQSECNGCLGAPEARSVCLPMHQSEMK